MKHIITYKKHLFIFVVLLAISSTSYGEERDKSIITFGDSITVGVWVITDIYPGDRTGGYQPYLEAHTDAIENHYDALNYGFAGERTVYDPDNHPERLGGVERLKQEVLPAQPNAEYILIMEGTNDVWSGISHTTTGWALGDMIQQSKDYGIIPLIGTLTPDARSGMEDLKDIQGLNNRIRALAAQYKIVVADFYPAMIDQWKYQYASSDLLHPSLAGYIKMAEIWFEALELPIPEEIYPPTWWLHLLLGK